MEVTIYDILKNRKALQLLTKVNGYDIKITWKHLSAHERPLWGRNKRSAKINQTVDWLYKKTKIKDFFPTLTRPKLKNLLEDFTEQVIQRQRKRHKRQELLKLRRCKRLLPLSEEKYDELRKRSEKWEWVVNVPQQLHSRGYFSISIYTSSKPFSQITLDRLYQLDEKRKDKPTKREYKYA